MKQYFDAYFDVLAEQGDPDYRTFYGRVVANPEESVYKSMDEGIERLANERVVLHVTDLILYYHFVGKQTVPGMYIFAQGRPEVKGPMITKNSPLGKTYYMKLEKLCISIFHFKIYRTSISYHTVAASRARDHLQGYERVPRIQAQTLRL